MTDRLRVALLADETIPKWQIDALNRAVNEVDIEIPLVIVNQPETVVKKSDIEGADKAVSNPRGLGMSDVKLFVELLRQQGLWTFVLAEQKLSWMFCGTDRRWEFMQQTPVRDVDVLTDSKFVDCTPETDDSWNLLPSDVIARVASDADVAIRFGFGLLKGDILTAVEHGVLSFHPADIRKYRGQGPEQIFYNGDDRGGVTLQRLTDDIDAGEVVTYGETDMSDARTLDEVWIRIHNLEIELLAKGLRNLIDESYAPTTVSDLGTYYSHKERRRAAFVARVMAKNITGRIRTCLAR